MPVAAAFMLAPGVVLSLRPAPCVRMDNDMRRGRIDIFRMRVPAIAVFVANNRRGSRVGCKGQRNRAEETEQG